MTAESLVEVVKGAAIFLPNPSRQTAQAPFLRVRSFCSRQSSDIYYVRVDNSQNRSLTATL